MSKSWAANLAQRTGFTSLALVAALAACRDKNITIPVQGGDSSNMVSLDKASKEETHAYLLDILNHMEEDLKKPGSENIWDVSGPRTVINEMLLDRIYLTKTFIELDVSYEDVRTSLKKLEKLFPPTDFTTIFREQYKDPLERAQAVVDYLVAVEKSGKLFKPAEQMRQAKEELITQLDIKGTDGKLISEKELNAENVKNALTQLIETTQSALQSEYFDTPKFRGPKLYSMDAKSEFGSINQIPGYLSIAKGYLDLERFEDAVYPITRASRLAAEISILTTNRDDSASAADQRNEFDKKVATRIYTLAESLNGWNAISVAEENKSHSR